jgi:chaperone BCS1
MMSPESSTITTSTELWLEPLDTPGIVPRHLKRSATASFPILEVLQRILSRLRPQGTTSDIEKVLALIGLYQAVKPVAKEIMAWMGAEVIRTAHNRSAMLVTGGLETVNHHGFSHPMRFSPSPIGGDHIDEEVACLPPIGTRIFW